MLLSTLALGCPEPVTEYVYEEADTTSPAEDTGADADDDTGGGSPDGAAEDTGGEPVPDASAAEDTGGETVPDASEVPDTTEPLTDAEDTAAPDDMVAPADSQDVASPEDTGAPLEDAEPPVEDAGVADVEPPAEDVEPPYVPFTVAGTGSGQCSVALSVCSGSCGSDLVCLSDCAAPLGPLQALKYNKLMTCLNTSCDLAGPVEVWVECAFNSCAAAFEACNGGAPTPVTKLCGELLVCTSECLDQGCVDACTLQGTVAANAAFSEFWECLLSSCPTGEPECVAAAQGAGGACEDVLTACVKQGVPECGACYAGTTCGPLSLGSGICFGEICGAVSPAGTCWGDDLDKVVFCDDDGLLRSLDCADAPLTGPKVNTCKKDVDPDTGLLVARCVCAPTCSPGSCGDDGCGGSCGTCGDTEQCVGGTCVPVADPLSCAGRCGDVDPELPCQCNDGCVAFGDCCEDRCDVCEELPSCKPVVGSCAGRCGAAYDPAQTCQCNSACVDFGNCCEDICDVCGESAPCKPIAPSCAGRCDAPFDPSAPCQCNAECANFGNCCADICLECLDSSPAACQFCALPAFRPLYCPCSSGSQCDGTCLDQPAGPSLCTSSCQSDADCGSGTCKADFPGPGQAFCAP